MSDPKSQGLCSQHADPVEWCRMCAEQAQSIEDAQRTIRETVLPGSVGSAYVNAVGVLMATADKMLEAAPERAAKGGA